MVFTNLFHLVLIRNYNLSFKIPLCSCSSFSTITSCPCLHPGTHTWGIMEPRDSACAYTCNLNVPETILWHWGKQEEMVCNHIINQLEHPKQGEHLPTACREWFLTALIPELCVGISWGSATGHRKKPCQGLFPQSMSRMAVLGTSWMLLDLQIQPQKTILLPSFPYGA